MQLSNHTNVMYSGWMHYTYRRMYACADALTYLFNIYLHSWLGEYKTGNISETVQDRAKVSINVFNGLYKVVQWLSIAAKMNDLE